MYSLGQLASLVGAKLIGDPEVRIASIAGLDQATENDISFLSSAKFRRYLKSSRAAAVIVSEADIDAVRGNALVVADPYLCFARVTALLYPEPALQPGVDATACVDSNCDIDSSAQIAAQAVIGPGCQIGKDVYIGPGCVLENNVSIGEGTRLVANVTVRKACRIGKRCILHPGAVIGADGFGFANEKGKWIKIAQIGTVVIGDDVEVGANTTIDRGALGDTVIADGVKLDNLIQVAHNVKIGEHTAIAAQTGIAGSTEIGSYCAIGGKVGIVGHLKITDRVTVTAMSLVTNSISEPGSYSSGVPAHPSGSWHRNFARIKKLDNMAKRLKRVEMRLDQESNKSQE